METDTMVSMQELSKVIVYNTKTGEIVNIIEEVDLNRYPSTQYRQIRQWENA